LALRILADENVALDIVLALRGAGHDIVWAAEIDPRQADEHWLALAEAERRLLLTHDKDFGDLVFRDRWPATSGVFLLRLGAMDARLQAALVKIVLDQELVWYRSFSVLTPRLLRQVRLPRFRATP
jgi:predicted nuclease of predicted toxin-antitoxin system